MRRLVACVVLASACGGDDAADELTGQDGASETGPACVLAQDDTVGPPVQVTIVNSTFGVVWLAPDTFGGAGFTLRDADGDAFAHAANGCLPGCNDVEANPQRVCIDCDPNAGAELVRIEPEGRWTTTWAGAAFETDDAACVEAQCTDPMTHADACSVAREVGTGAFQVLVEAFAEANGCVNPSCDCTPDADGACLVVGTPTGLSIPAMGALDVPNQTTIELTVQN